MSENTEIHEFSEDGALRFISQRLPEALKSRLSGDDILDVVDAAYDYYDKNGLLDFSDLDSDVDEQKMAKYIVATVGFEISEEEALRIVGLENDYEDSLNDF